MSAFANSSGGVILLGVENKTTEVYGLTINERNSKEDIEERVTSIVEKMFCHVTLERGVHWNIEFFPVSGSESNAAHVVVISVAGMGSSGGVFTSCPKSFELRPGDDEKEVSLSLLEFQEWRSRMLSGMELQSNSKDSGPTLLKDQECILNITLATNPEGWNTTVNGQLVTELAKSPRVKVCGLVPSSTQEQRDQAKRSNIELVNAREMTGYSEKDCLAYPPNSLDIDILIIHSYGIDLGRQAQGIKETKKCKWVHVVHTVSAELEQYVEKASSSCGSEHEVQLKLCQQADIVIAIVPKVADAYESALCFCGKDKDVINLTPGIVHDLVGIRPVHADRQVFRVMISATYPAKYFKVKGCGIAAKAITLQDPSSMYQLIFVVLPDDNAEDVKTQLKDDIRQSQYIVKHVGRNTEDWKQLLCEVDLAIMPSAEGFGTSGVRAISADLPVIISENSGLGMTLKKLPSGGKHVVDSEDPQVWADKIKEVREKGSQTCRLESEQLRNEYMKKFNWKEQCDKLVDKMIEMFPSKQGVVASESDYKSIGDTKVIKELSDSLSNFSMENDIKTDVTGYGNSGNKDQTDSKDQVNSGGISRGPYYQETGQTDKVNSGRSLKRVEAGSLVTEIITEDPFVMDELALQLDYPRQNLANSRYCLHLAHRLGVPQEIVKQCQKDSHYRPSAKMFAYLSARHPGFTIDLLKSYSTKISRGDVVKSLNESGLKGNDTLTKLREEKPETFHDICVNLDCSRFNNWEDLGKVIQPPIPPEVLEKCARSGDYTETVLNIIYTRQPELPVEEMKRVLKDMKRGDVCDELCKLPGNSTIKTLLDDFDVLKDVSRLLDKDEPPSNWKDFAQKHGVSKEECEYLCPVSVHSPTKPLMEYTSQAEPKLTLESFIEALLKIERIDIAIVSLKEFFDHEDIDVIVESARRKLQNNQTNNPGI